MRDRLREKDGLPDRRMLCSHARTRARVLTDEGSFADDFPGAELETDVLNGELAAVVLGKRLDPDQALGAR
jgi:hypothetical protein